VLKKLTATGIFAGAATAVILAGGPAHADRLAASPSYPAACYYTAPGYVPPAWCNTTLVPPPVTVYPPTTYYPGYPGGYGYGWNRWHGGWGYPHHWHR
jgi:hypothetical protein